MSGFCSDSHIYRKIQDHCYFRIRTNGIVGRGKGNLTSNDVEDIDLSVVFVVFFPISSTI